MSARAKSKSKKSTASKAAKVSRVTKVSSSNGLPKLADNEWNMAGILGLVLLVAAIAQLINYNDFKDLLANYKIAGPSAWAVILIVAEVWAGVSLLKVKVTESFRNIGLTLSVVVPAVWFYLVASTFINDITITNTGFFGNYLVQAAGWWTIVQTAVVTLWAIYTVPLFKQTKWTLLSFVKNFGR